MADSIQQQLSSLTQGFAALAKRIQALAGQQGGAAPAAQAAQAGAGGPTGTAGTVGVGMAADARQTVTGAPTSGLTLENSIPKGLVRVGSFENESFPRESVPEPGPKVFIVGNRKKFGGRTVRKGLEALLKAHDKEKQGKKHKGKTYGVISDAEAEQLRKLLKSNDPEVKKVLDSKVPNKKSLLIDAETGKILDTVDTKAKVMAEKSLQMEKHKTSGWDRSAGGNLTVGEKTYQVAGTELHSPIKIALDGQDARLNSTNGFRIDLDGFDQGNDAVTTSGGLNSNEAWLVRDKDGDGIMRGGVVDGRDVYGDHEGKFSHGYDELARDYSDELKVDPQTGRRYLDLTDPNSRAARELKLLDASGNLTEAGKVLSRIDVDHVDVRESDASGQNQIRQRAEVTYRDGHTATSADQWYATH